MVVTRQALSTSGGPVKLRALWHCPDGEWRLFQWAILDALPQFRTLTALFVSGLPWS